jgi:hypothetical protein
MFAGMLRVYWLNWFGKPAFFSVLHKARPRNEVAQCAEFFISGYGVRLTPSRKGTVKQNTAEWGNGILYLALHEVNNNLRYWQFRGISPCTRHSNSVPVYCTLPLEPR